MVVVLLVHVFAAAAVSTGSSFGRRTAVGGAAAAAAVGLRPPPAFAGGLSRSQLQAKLSRVPLFIITNKDEQPYLTEVDAEGRRSGFFYIR